MFEKIISVGFLMGVVFLSIVSMFSDCEYINNVANGIAVPIFAWGILDFVIRLKNNTIMKIKEKRNIDVIELKWLTPYCNLVEANPNLEDKKCLSDREVLEKEIVLFDCEKTKLEKWFSWCIPTCAVVVFITFVLAVLANLEWVKIVMSNINSTILTLWTLSILLFDAIFEEYLSKTFIKKAEKSVKENKVRNF